MFPAEAAGDFWFEGYVSARIPLVEEGVADEGLVEAKGKVAERRDLVPRVGIIETDGATVAGGQKKDDGCKNGSGAKGHGGGDPVGHCGGQAGTVRHKEVRLKFLYKTTLIYKKTVKIRPGSLAGKRRKQEF